METKFTTGPNGQVGPILTEEEKASQIAQLQKDMEAYQKQEDTKILKNDIDVILKEPHLSQFQALGKKSTIQNQSYNDSDFKMIYRLINIIEKSNRVDTGCGSCRAQTLARLNQLYNHYYPQK